MTVGRRALQFGHRLAGSVRAQAVVLVYHRVAEVAEDPWSLAVRPPHFADHLDVLRRRARPQPLAHLTAALRDGRPIRRGAVAVTFDDGYADNLTDALPALERHDVPASVFVTTGGLGRGEPFWWDVLEAILPHETAAELRVVVRDEPHEWTLPDQHARREAYHDLWSLLHPLDADERGDVLDQIAPHLGGRTGAPRLTPEGVAVLAASPLVEVGAHTVSHPSLAALPAPRQRAEIEQSKADLEQITGAPVRAFSYPFGKRPDVSAETVELVCEAGFESACLNVPAPVTRSTDPYRIPRVYITDMDGDRFEKTLRSWTPLLS